MFGKLQPEPSHFRRAYSKWIEQTTELIAGSPEGTTFGIFGAWGSGKTSATKALQDAVELAMRAPLQPENSIGVAYLDCSGLKSATPSEVKQSVQGKLVRGNVVKQNSQFGKHIFTFFREASGVLAAAPDPWSKVAAATVKAGANAALEREAKSSSELRPEVAPNIEKAFIFLDDLDRCDADVAWAVLRHARLGLPTAKTVSVIVCDPVVLGPPHLPRAGSSARTRFPGCTEIH